MRVLKIDTEENFPAVIEEVTKKELLSKNIKKNFGFDWSLESEYEIFKIRRAEHDEVLELMSIIDYPEELRLHINLLENSLENQGSGKKFSRVAGTLIAMACEIAVDKGYGGFVSLVPKTKLINHYIENYGFIQMGRQLAVYFETSDFLIEKYLNDEEI